MLSIAKASARLVTLWAFEFPAFAHTLRTVSVFLTLQGHNDGDVLECLLALGSGKRNPVGTTVRDLEMFLGPAALLDLFFVGQELDERLTQQCR
jgi:hypothetical protein